jgi:hypothetical protein
MTTTTVPNQPSTLQHISNGRVLESKSITWEQFAAGDFTPLVKTFQPNPNSYWDMALNRVYAFAKDQLQRKETDDATLRRLDKGFRLVAMHRVQQQNERYVSVTSEQGQRNYTVDSAEKTCDCPFFTHHEEVCCHLFAARIFRRTKDLTAFAVEQDRNGNHAAQDADNVQQSPMNAHQEANYSVNFRTTYRGIENVQFTVRGSSQVELMERLNSAIDGIQVSVSHHTDTDGHVDVKRCPIHDIDMPARVSKKTGRAYYGHRVGQSMCFGD